jgi:hypothetical protein
MFSIARCPDRVGPSAAHVSRNMVVFVDGILRARAVNRIADLQGDLVGNPPG